MNSKEYKHELYVRPSLRYRLDDSELESWNSCTDSEQAEYIAIQKSACESFIRKYGLASATEEVSYVRALEKLREVN